MIKVKISHNTWLEFSKETPKEEIDKRVEKHLKGYRDIYIIGEKPKWVKNVKHIHLEDDKNPAYKERNIFRKINRAIEEESLSDSFFFTNDDIFLLGNFEAENFPFYHKRFLFEAIDKNFSDYRITLSKTARLLQDLCCHDFNYDIHTPIIYNKESFKKLAKEIDFDTRFGYAIKSLYCNLYGVNGEYMEDCKFTGKITYEEVKKRSEGRSIISCNDAPMYIRMDI